LSAARNGARARHLLALGYYFFGDQFRSRFGCCWLASHQRCRSGTALQRQGIERKLALACTAAAAKGDTGSALEISHAHGIPLK
jgi:hypothetical protein